MLGISKKNFKKAVGILFKEGRIEFARNVMIKKSFAKQDAPKKVIVLDIQEKTAAGKVYAWWGIDYVLLSKDNDKWMIEQVLWEGPPAKENK